MATNLELAEQMFVDAFVMRNTARAAVDAAAKMLEARDAEMAIATGIYDRAIAAAITL